MSGWSEFKQFVERASNLSMDSLHLLAGALLFFALCLLLRRPAADGRPWLAVLLVTLLNEAADLWTEQWPSLGMQLGEAFKDIVLTMLLPTLVLLTARHAPQLYGRSFPPDEG